MAETVRLTAAQAVIRFLAAQSVERDGVEQPFFAGMFGIFGHGNVAGLGEALEEAGDAFRYFQARNEQAMVHASAAFEQGGEERPGTQLRDPQLQITRRRGQRPRPTPVALRGPLSTAFPGAGADHRGQLGVDQRLVDRLRGGADPVLHTASLHRFEHLE